MTLFDRIEEEQKLAQFDESYEKVLYDYDSKYFTLDAIYDLSSETLIISHRMKYLTKKKKKKIF